MTTITTSAFYERSSRALGDLRRQAESLQGSIGTGQRLLRGSDDPVGAAQLRSLSREGSFAQISTAAGVRVSSDLALTDSALSDFSAYVTRIKELAVQAASDTLTTSQRGGKIAMSTLPVPGTPLGEVSTVKIEGSGWS